MIGNRIFEKKPFERANNMNKKEIIKQGINLFNKHFPNDKHTTENEKSI